MQSSSSRRWNKVWIIGASTGIGRELALAIAPKCDHVWVSSRNVEKLEEVARSLPNITAIPLEINDSQQVSEVAAQIEQCDSGCSSIDLVVISSAIGLMSKLPKFDPELYRRSMETNYLGTVNAIAAVLPAMVNAQRGHIAMIASIAGYRGLPNGAPYAPTKAALISLAECIRPSLKRLGINVSIINPGFVDTPMTEQNKFSMPLLMKPQEAARRIVRGLEQGRYEIAFPRRMAYLLKLFRILPNNLFFLLADRLMLGKKK